MINVDLAQWHDVIDRRPDIARKHDIIGIGHNIMLEEVYSELNDKLQHKLSKSRKIIDEPVYLSQEEYFSVIESYFKKYSVFSSQRALDLNNDEKSEVKIYESIDDVGYSTQLIEQIHKVDRIAEKPNLSVYQVVRDIELLEREVVEEELLSEEDLNIFLSYSSTARASTAFWTNNMSKWDRLTNNDAGQDLVKLDFWNQKVTPEIYNGIWKTNHYLNQDNQLILPAKAVVDVIKKAVLIAAADAAGAAIGASIGSTAIFTIGATTIGGAAAFAVIVGATSSAATAGSGEFSIVVPVHKVHGKEEI